MVQENTAGELQDRASKTQETAQIVAKETCKRNILVVEIDVQAPLDLRKRQPESTRLNNPEIRTP